MSDLKRFQEIIGYTFKNEQLLKQALTHSSYANEKHLKKLSFVRDFHLGEYGEGDAGVTIVEFK